MDKVLYEQGFPVGDPEEKLPYGTKNLIQILVLAVIFSGTIYGYRLHIRSKYDLRLLARQPEAVTLDGGVTIGLGINIE
jgi:hypothetical protein